MARNNIYKIDPYRRMKRYKPIGEYEIGFKTISFKTFPIPIPNTTVLIEYGNENEYIVARIEEINADGYVLGTRLGLVWYGVQQRLEQPTSETTEASVGWHATAYAHERAIQKQKRLQAFRQAQGQKRPA
jgi:hypothetical protein